jgi:RNA polymerase sporulation-specific sigma factor
VVVNTKKTPLIKDYSEMRDENIIKYIQSGDSNALDFLINKYKNFVEYRVSSYYIIGADKEDLIQEGMIGLFKAIRDFNNDRNTSFKTFADMCIKRQVITAIKSATRQKHIPLNSYISLDGPVSSNDDDRSLLELLSGKNSLNPEELLITNEKAKIIENILTELLTDLEKNVLILYLEGQTYKEISEKFNRSVKAIDNALTRVKRKLERYINKNDIFINY